MKQVADCDCIQENNIKERTMKSESQEALDCS